MDHQDISNQMKEFIRMREELKQGKPVDRKRGPVEDLPKNARRPYKELPAFKPRPGEKPRNFLHRVNAVTSSNLKEAQYEAKYNVDVVRTEAGDVKVQKRSEAEMLELDGGQKRKRNADDDQDGHKDQPKKSTPGVKKRKERFDKKKLKREKKAKVREELAAEKQQMYQREDIKFGDICHAPPQLKAIPRRGEKPETVPRPGKKASLLLHSLIDAKKANPKQLQSRDLGMRLKTGKLNLKGKRKELPMRTREAIEEEQRSVVQQYRELKKQKMAQAAVPI